MRKKNGTRKPDKSSFMIKGKLNHVIEDTGQVLTVVYILVKENLDKSLTGRFTFFDSVFKGCKRNYKYKFLTKKTKTLTYVFGF